MRNIILVILLVSFTVHSQNVEKPFEFQDSLFSVSVYKNIKLLDKFTLKPGLTIRHKTVFNTFETPMFLDYQSSEETSYFIGVSSRTAINRTEFGLRVPYIPEPSKVFFSAGSEFKLKNDTNGHFSINFPLEMNMGIKF